MNTAKPLFKIEKTRAISEATWIYPYSPFAPMQAEAAINQTASI